MVTTDSEQSPTPDDVKLIRNERTKLTATWLNGLAVAAVAVGGIAPTVAIFAGSASPLTAFGLLVTWTILAGGLHLVARHLLKGLRA